MLIIDPDIAQLDPAIVAAVRSIENARIAYRKDLFSVVGSIDAVLMLSQALYWSEITRDPEGWFYKTAAQWEQETHLTRERQDAARKRLRQHPFWQEKRKAIGKNPATVVHYRIDDMLYTQALIQTCRNLADPQSAMCQRHKAEIEDENNDETDTQCVTDTKHNVPLTQSYRDSPPTGGNPSETKTTDKDYTSLSDGLFSDSDSACADACKPDSPSVSQATADKYPPHIPSSTNANADTKLASGEARIHASVNAASAAPSNTPGRIDRDGEKGPGATDASGKGSVTLPAVRAKLTGMPTAGQINAMARQVAFMSTPSRQILHAAEFPDFAQRFEELWNSSPRRGSKADAKKAAGKLLAGAYQELLPIMPSWFAYWQSMEAIGDGQYIPHLSTFFRKLAADYTDTGGGWDEFLKPPPLRVPKTPRTDEYAQDRAKLPQRANQTGLNGAVKSTGRTFFYDDPLLSPKSPEERQLEDLTRLRENARGDLESLLKRIAVAAECGIPLGAGKTGAELNRLTQFIDTKDAQIQEMERQIAAMRLEEGGSKDGDAPRGLFSSEAQAETLPFTDDL